MVDILVHYGQMAGWIKMKLGTETGLGPGHIVMVALHSRCGHYIFVLLLSSFLFLPA